MPYTRSTFRAERARQIARSGSLSGESIQPRPWWPEEVCARIDKIVWMVYCLGEPGEDWHHFTAYDARGQILGVHRVEGF
jgi:hypothetical protein